MFTLLNNFKIVVNDKLYVKDPETSDLGRKIVENSILLINEIGFDNFTFKKLGERIGSNESSLYRYFENKHKLLIYLSSWYWSWLELKLVLATNSIPDPKEKLIVGLKIVTQEIENDDNFKHVNEGLLNKIIIREFSKSYLTKEVDDENKEGYFSIYKRMINRIIEFMDEYNPTYPHSKSLASTVIEGAMHQHFLKTHFKSITNCNADFTPTDFYTDLVLKQLTHSIE